MKVYALDKVSNSDSVRVNASFFCFYFCREHKFFFTSNYFPNQNIELVENAMANIQNVSKMTSDTIQNFMTDLKFDCLTITLLNVYFHDPEVRKL